MHAVARLVRIRGSVQGVGYRDATVRQAHALGVAGWVRNRRDGSVEAFVQGTPEAVAALVLWCHDGSSLARVTAVEVVEAQPHPAHTTFEWHATA